MQLKLRLPGAAPAVEPMLWNRFSVDAQKDLVRVLARTMVQAVVKGTERPSEKGEDGDERKR